MGKNGNYEVKQHAITTDKPEMFAFIVSLLVATLLGGALLCLVLFGINYLTFSLISKGKKQAIYSDIKKNQCKNNNEIREFEGKKSKMENKLSSNKSEAPPNSISFIKNFKYLAENSIFISTFIDYLVVTLNRMRVDSIELFFKNICGSYPKTEMEPLIETKELIEFNTIRDLYQEFCFMNDFTEQKFKYSNVLSNLTKIGYKIEIIENSSTVSYCSMILKTDDQRWIFSSNDIDHNSLALFIKYKVNITNFFEDQVDINEFFKKYDEFCKFNRLEALVVTPQLLKQKFYIDTTSIPKYFIRKDPKFITTNSMEMYIETNNIENYIKFLADDTVTLSAEDIKFVKKQIYSSEGAFYEILTIILQIVLLLFLIAPIIILLICLGESYTPYTLKNPEYLLNWYIAILFILI